MIAHSLHIVTLWTWLLFLSLTSTTTAQAPFPHPPSTHPPFCTSSTPNTYDAIRNTLNTYPLAIDSKNFSLLSSVFTPDAIANYTAPLGVLTGLPAIASTLQQSLETVMTQHALSTQVIEMLGHGRANTTTYYTASHFGVGVWEGEVAYAYGRYEDELVCVRGGEEPCLWRVQTRTLVYMVSACDNSMLVCFALFVRDASKVVEPS